MRHGGRRRRDQASEIFFKGKERGLEKSLRLFKRKGVTKLFVTFSGGQIVGPVGGWVP